MLSVSTDTGVVAWYENRLREASADFAPPRIVASDAQGAAKLYAADLDGDGDPDLVFARNGQIAWIENRLGEADASFAPSRIIAPLSEPSFAASIALADVDGDGDRDVVATDGASLFWYANRLGETSADFGPPRLATSIPGNPAGNAFGIVAADFDGDTDPDVLWQIPSIDEVEWSQNRVTGPSADFGPHHSVAVFPYWSTQVLAAADLDGDEDQEILMSGTGSLRWYGNPGTDPNNPDSDGDGFTDGYEVAHGWDPTTPGQGLPEPGRAVSLAAGIAALWLLARRRRAI